MRNIRWSCFACRSTFNREHTKCPSCGGKLHLMGKYFKPPARTKDKEWQAIEMLIKAGILYNHDHFYGQRPRTPAAVRDYLQRDEVQAWIQYWKTHHQQRQDE